MAIQSLNTQIDDNGIQCTDKFGRLVATIGYDNGAWRVRFSNQYTEYLRFEFSAQYTNDWIKAAQSIRFFRREAAELFVLSYFNQQV